MNGKLLLGSALLAAAPLTGASGEGGGGESGEDGLIAMEAIAVPIIDGAKMEGTLHFRLVLEARDSEAAHHIAGHLPELRAEALATGVEFSRLRVSPFLAVDAHQLAEDLTQALRARDEGIARALLVEVTAKSS